MAPVLSLAHSVSSILNEDFFIVPDWGIWARIAALLLIGLYLMLAMPRMKAGVAAVVNTSNPNDADRHPLYVDDNEHSMDSTDDASCVIGIRTLVNYDQTFFSLPNVAKLNLMKSHQKAIVCSVSHFRVRGSWIWPSRSFASARLMSK